MKARMILAAVVIALARCVGSAQQDSLVDVFPLAIGNQWVYRYFAQTTFNGGGGLLITTDSGQAQYRVVSSSAGTNAISWGFRRTRDIIHHVSVPDSTFRIQDTVTFIMAEDLSGQHKLYRLTSDPLDVFPNTIDFTDTTRIYRYRRVGAGDTVRFQSRPPMPFPPPDYKSIFTFKKGVGQLGYEFVGGPMDFYMQTRHQILSWVITDVPDDHPAEELIEFRLSQNYPNPFNPSTTIKFQVASFEFVSLKVFDVLGREVATLVNERKHAGQYTSEFDASNLPSGVYFYQVRTAGFVATKKMMLIR
jgi:hypothetical protein